MKMIVLLIAAFAGLSISAATNEVTVLKQNTTNSVPVKIVKSAKQSRPRCEAITLSGNRCKRHSVAGSQYCSQHATILRKQKERAQSE